MPCNLRFLPLSGASEAGAAAAAMRHSKSLSSLATWSNKLRSSSSKGALDTSAAEDERVYPTTADAYELLEDCGRGVR